MCTVTITRYDANQYSLYCLYSLYIYIKLVKNKQTKAKTKQKQTSKHLYVSPSSLIVHL